MKRVLIVAYYFPPGKSTAANRIKSWADYFAENGLFPIVVTRDWNTGSEFKISDITEAKVVLNETSEVHYVPYLGNKRTNIGDNRGKLLTIARKFLTFTEIIFGSSFSKLLPYHNLIRYAIDYAGKSKPDLVLISGGPFQLFLTGHEIKNKYNIPWIADYRDGWTEFDYNIVNVPLLSVVNKAVDKYHEKKWLNTVAFFTTVSGFLKEKIAKRIGKNGYTIYNGSNNAYLKSSNVPKIVTSELIILYSGEIYDRQCYEAFLDAISSYNKKHACSVKLIFLGTRDSHHQIPERLYKNVDWIEITERLPLVEALTIQQKADCFLMLHHEGMKGLISSKIFDYLMFKKPIMLYKSDKDIVEEVITKSNLGIITNNEEEIHHTLDRLISAKRAEGRINTQPNMEYISQFTREAQASKLANIIKDYLLKDGD